MSVSMSNDGHRKRLRSRFLDAPEKLPDYEFLELLLGYPLLRRDTKPLAKALIARFGTLRGVLDARAEEYQDLPGVGDGVTSFISCLRELLARYEASPVLNREVLVTPEIIAKVAQKRLGSLLHEEIWVAYVDGGSRLITWERGNRGTVDAALVFPRNIIEKAIRLKAKGFILVHNHPGGDTHPSEADTQFTNEMALVAKQLHIQLVDHIIVTDTLCYSILSQGLL